MNKTIDCDYPITENTALYLYGKSSCYDEKAEALRQKILNLPDTVKPSESGTTYYISYKGDDANSGTSPEEAWLTPLQLQSTDFPKAGDVVLFERGGIYRARDLSIMPGVHYGAYGEGPKPAIYGSYRNYADAELWEKTDIKNVWMIKLPQDIQDVGNVVFDHGKACTTDGKRMENTLTKDFDFYWDNEKARLYLYLAAGNPADIYSDIEIIPKVAIFRHKGSVVGELDDVLIENLCLKYSDYGIITAQSHYVTVRGCEIGWIGGCILQYHTADGRVIPTRAGNGIEFFTECDHMTVENCWIYLCYDAGYTNQGPGFQKYITVRENLMEYSPYNIEIWTDRNKESGGLVGCVYEKNILRFAGFGTGTHCRIGSSTEVIANFSMYNYVVPCTDTIIRNNVFDTSYRYVASIAYPNDPEGRGPKIEGNTWIQQPYTTDDTSASVNRIYLNGEAEILLCETQEQMENSVGRVDAAPAAVILDC